MAAPDDFTLFNLIKTLTELPGPVGDEGAVQDWLASHWAEIGLDVERTRVGNLIARVGGSGRRLLIAGHADEICLMVKSVSKSGFLHLWPYYNDALGQPPRWFVPVNQPALVLGGNRPVEGSIATASGHVIGGRVSKKTHFDWNDWFVDIGVRTRDEVEALGIGPGCRVIWNPPTRRVGRNVVGKAMDDRAALAIATLLAQRLTSRQDLAYEVWVASTIQEENGLIGAASIALHHSFDMAVALDVGLTGDIPGPDPIDFPCTLGAGPTIVFQDASCHYSGRLSNLLMTTARCHEIPMQRAIFQHYGSDGASFVRQGIETALLTYPTRYTHSPIETVDLDDIQGCVDLLERFVTDHESQENRESDFDRSSAHE